MGEKLFQVYIWNTDLPTAFLFFRGNVCYNEKEKIWPC